MVFVSWPGGIGAPNQLIPLKGGKSRKIRKSRKSRKNARKTRKN